MNIINPFSDYGGIIVGERFVGRGAECNEINQRLLGQNFGNLAIIGLPRIGKSSLAWNALMLDSVSLNQKGIFPVWISFGEFTSLTEVFSELFFQLLENEQLTEINRKQLNELYKKFESSVSKLEEKRFIKKILKFLKNSNIRLIAIFDEFDNSKSILDLSDFQFLREVCINPLTKYSLLTISRKTLQDLEPENGALSNFYQIFTDIRLKLFSKEDFEKYWQRLRNKNIEISNEYIECAKFYCGGHPYLLDVFNHEVFSKLNSSFGDITYLNSKVTDKLNLTMMNEYESIIKLMQNEGLDRILMQMIVGPVYDITRREAEMLSKYGLVSDEDKNSYKTFSDHFTEYLKFKSSEIDIWPLWSEVENGVRHLIKAGLSDLYGEDWESEYIKKYKQKNAEAFINDKRFMQSKNEKAFGRNVSNHLVDYTYPMEMYDKFIALDWDWHSQIFGKQKADWKSIFEHLGKIRNPLAHNNPDFLSSSDIVIAEGYCKLILEKIDSWKK